MDKRDEYIKAQMQQDKEISNKANEVFKNFERRIEMEENNKPKEKKVIKISLQHAVLAFTSLLVVVVLGGNLYAHIKGRPNIYSAIKGLFVKEDKYTASEIVVDQTVESNGVKLTLKTVAMDENILITKYVAEGEKLTNEFYAYQEFEQDVIELVKISLTLAEWDIMKDDPEYKDVTSKDAVAQAQLISKRLSVANLTEEEKETLMESAIKAYQEFIVLELNPEDTSEEKVNKLIEETIAMFESKVNSKYDVMASDTKLQEFGIQTISEKVEKSGNEYIIYNVYNVDTISDLASKFNLSVNVNKIGNIEGKWNFNTELEKARLDTRVETIDFYENNSCDNVAPAITVADGVRHSATVEAKKLVISDFSTVLMIQTKVADEDREYYLEYANDGLPCIFVVTDESGNVLGTGTCSENSYNSAMDIGESVIYTDRIILKNVNKDTKKIYVKIYEQYDMDGEAIKVNNEIIELDIEAARSNSKPVELNQTYTSKQCRVSFRYPGNWTITEEQDQIIIKGPEDIDGNSVDIYMMPDTEDSAHPGQNSKEIIEGLYNTYSGLGEECEKGEINIAGTTGYYFSHYFYGRVDGKSKIVCVDRDEKQFTIDYSGILTQYERYEETFNKIVETIEFLEAEKSYVTYYMDNSSDSYETVKVYEDNTITVQISENAREIWTKGSDPKIEANVEYEITGVDSKIAGTDSKTRGIEFLKAVEGGAYVGSCIFIYGGNNELYLVDMHKGILTGNFEAKEIELENGYWGGVYCEAVRDQEGYEKLIAFVQDPDGQKYIISRDGTVEKYIPPKQEENPDTNQEQTQQPITDEQAKEVIQKYLDIYSAYRAGPLEMLAYSSVLDMEFNVDYEVSVTENDHKYVYTGVKFEDFKNEMLKYMTESMYVRTFSPYYKDINGLLFAENVGASGIGYEILEIEYIESNGEYRVNVNEIFGEEVNQETISFELVYERGNIVVSSWGVG